jgi:hypothetical protein
LLAKGDILLLAKVVIPFLRYYFPILFNVIASFF